MLKLSKDRIQQLARQIVDEMSAHQNVRLLKDAEQVRQSVIQAFSEELRQDEERQARVLDRLAQSEERPSFGSGEWDSIYLRLLQEEYDTVGGGEAAD